MRALATLLLAALLAAFGASRVAALERIDHPALDGFSEGVAGFLREERERLETLRRDRRVSGQDYGRLGMAYHAHEQHLAAAQAYRNAAELAPADARWPYFLGVLAAMDGDFPTALTHFDGSLERNPDYLPTRIRRARALLQSGRTAEAQALLTLLAESYPDVAVLHADLGTLAAQGGRPGEAVERLERALALQPRATRLHYPLAQAYRALGEVDAAREHLARQGPQEVVFDDPLLSRMRSLSRSFAYYMSLGLAAARNDEFRTALNLMERAVQADPDNPEARVNLARMHEALGRPERALAILDAVLERNPRHAAAHLNRGAILEVQGDDDAAAQAYRAALESQPDLFEARLGLASALMRSAQWSEAAGHYEQAFELRPGRTELLLYRAVAQEAAGRCGEAVESLLELVRRLPEDFPSLMAYARVVATCEPAKARHLGNALNAARNMYTLAPELPVVTTLAMVEAAAGNFGAAVDFQTQAGFLALREGGEAATEELRENLARYERGERAAAPWPDDYPYRSPRRLTLEDRR